MDIITVEEHIVLIINENSPTEAGAFQQQIKPYSCPEDRGEGCSSGLLLLKSRRRDKVAHQWPPRLRFSPLVQSSPMNVRLMIMNMKPSEAKHAA